jgi:hypothetical protein
LVYDLLFESAGNFEKFGKEAKEIQTGMIAVLHAGTEPVPASHYPHCIITGRQG